MDILLKASSFNNWATICWPVAPVAPMTMAWSFFIGLLNFKPGSGIQIIEDLLPAVLAKSSKFAVVVNATRPYKIYFFVTAITKTFVAAVEIFHYSTNFDAFARFFLFPEYLNIQSHHSCATLGRRISLHLKNQHTKQYENCY